jgi:hypothetical protein
MVENMTNNIKELQTKMVKDLVNFETIDLQEEHTDEIEKTYNAVYDILTEIIRFKDSTTGDNQ